MEQQDKYPIYKTPKGKVIEVKPDGQHGLWIINPHGVNIPNSLKGKKFTDQFLAGKEVTKWLNTLKEKDNG